MNLFSHLYFAQDELNSMYAAGLIYPDLNRKNKNKQFPNVDFQRGIDEHMKSAKLLHIQDWFTQGQNKLASNHQDMPFRFKRDMYHWGMEIAIDYFLLKQVSKKEVKKMEWLFRHKDIQDFLLEHDVHAAGMLHRMVENHRLESYRTLKGCVISLERSYKYIVSNHPQLAGDMHGHWYRIMSASNAYIEPKMDEIKNLFPVNYERNIGVESIISKK